jgi:hypothetical protein
MPARQEVNATDLWRGAYNKMSSSVTESTVSDMSDLSYEKELGLLVKSTKAIATL